MKELDAVLLHYLEKHYGNENARRKLAFEKILDMQDPELYLLVLGRKTSVDKDINHVVEILRNAPRY
jgi:succinate dehydrogenase flavin-adding protein (antitoxin of CptAB toxin-antitoxin module)